VNVAIKAGQTPKAHAKLAQMIDASSGKADVIAALRYLNSTVFTAEKNTQAAEAELFASIELDPDYLPAYSAYASLLASNGRQEEAIAQYRRVIEKRPSAQVYTMLGILFEGLGNSREAEAHYRKALEVTPETPIAANNLAWLIVENSGNLDEALQLASAAVAKDQTVAGYYDTLGYVYLKKGLMAPAVEQLKKAVAMEEANALKSGTMPNPGYRVRLGMALAKSGDKASARKEVETSLKYSAAMSQREAIDAKSVLNSL
jgi:Flp pilus assembly protein TadD